MNTRRTVVVLTPGRGHLQRLITVVAGLAVRGVEVHVMTRADERDQVETVGGRFIDLFARYPLDAVDRESMPHPCRFVTFAAAYAQSLTDDIARLRPSLIVYDSFVVVAPIVARRLGIPYVGMRAGHAQVPARAIAEACRETHTVISPACQKAVDQLRDEHDVEDASPFSYLAGVSPHLNLYPEPPQFLDAESCRAFEPVAFWGSLAPDLRDHHSRERPLSNAGRRFRIYASFGTIIWRYHSAVALEAFACVAQACTSVDATLLVSLGRYDDPNGGRRIARAGVRVETYVDQWGALKDADLFVTHHGLNSTHEAIYHRVPMLSYPFLGDQPAMAADCQRLGVASALTDRPMAPLDAVRVRQQVENVCSRRDEIAARLNDVRTWELDTIAGREAVLDRVMALA